MIGLVVLAGLFGLLIGSFLNVVVWRVPRGESLLPDSRCPKCDAAIRPWQNIPVISWLALRGKCANCKNPISKRYPLVELATGVIFALVTWWYASAFGDPFSVDGLVAVGWWAALAGYLWFAAASISLTLIDIELQRLPDAITGTSFVVVAALLGASAAIQGFTAGEWGPLIGVFGGAAAVFAFYFLVAFVYPKGMGGGDVKLAPLVGAALGYIGWSEVIIGTFAGFLFGALWGIALMLAKRAGRKTVIPFGPFMLLGAWAGLVAGSAVMDAYLSVSGLTS